MRKDPQASQEFLTARSWQRSNHSAETVRINKASTGPKFISHSLSGNERNHWFIRSKGNYVNLTPLSGIDTASDGRSYALLDYDRDGWMDVALANPTAPRTQLFRNRLGDLIQEPRKRFSIELRGGNTSATPSTDWSPRDGYGATVEITTSQRKRYLSHQAGEGLSAQNTHFLSIGLTPKEMVKKIHVTWPSGKKTHHRDILPNQSHITIQEK